MFKQKILLILCALIVIFLSLEISLRVAGFLYYFYKINNKTLNFSGKNTIRILCLGDSFTFGVGAENGNDYPRQLERLLNENCQDKKFIVYNRGIPGQNSSMVLKRLVHNINTYRPDTILLLIGSNNRTVLEDSNYYLCKKAETGKIINFFLKLDIALSKLRTYKLLRIVTLNLKNKFKSITDSFDITGKKNFEESTENLNKVFIGDADKKEDYLGAAETLYIERKFSAAEKMIKEMPENYKPEDKRVCFLLSNIYCEQERYDLALITMEEYIKNNPKDPVALFNLGRIYYKRGRTSPIAKEENFEQATRLFEESLPYIDSHNLLLKGEVYFNLAQLYLDKGEKEVAIKMMDEALKYRPDNSVFRQFRRVILEPFLSSEENEIFDKVLYYDLGSIINLCRLYNVTVILLNYPSENQNSIRKEIADKYKVPFINIGSGFAELLSNGYNYKDLFSNDITHPNANGYRVMAETVFEALKQQI